MRDRLQMVLDKFAALSSREQILVLVAVFAVAYQLADLVVLDRQYQRIEQLNQSIASDNATMKTLNAELVQLSSNVAVDPNRLLREQIDTLRSNTEDLQRRLAAQTRQMISPQDMARFLEQLLIQDEALSMLSLHTLEAEPLLDAEQTGALPQAAVGLHRHAFELEFSGAYLPTLRYLQALEALPWRFFWDSVSFDVVDYPNSVVRVRLHTLSLSEDWIGV